MAFRFSFFHTPKPRAFNYQPLYFDPVKEKWERRRAQLHAKMGEDKRKNPEERLFIPGASIRGSFQRARLDSRSNSGQNKYVRVVVILSLVALMVAIFYLANGFSLLFKLTSYPTLP